MATGDAEKLESLLRNDIHAETARIPWKELQYLFAGGKVIHVAAELDLVEVALQFSRDNRDIVESWISAGRIAPVSDDQARAWIETDADVWAVVVKPWILVQNPSNRRNRVH